MRIIRFQQGQQAPTFGIMEDEERLVPVRGDILGQWERLRSKIRLQDVRLLTPVLPPNIIAIGLNYRQHAEESGARIPDAPVIFLKSTSALIGPDEPIVLPAMAPSEVDYEAELVVIIGRRARNVSQEEALDYVLGYTCGNDVSARDCQLRLDMQWARGKSFDTFAPLGPWVETTLEPDNLAIRCRLNGELMQDSSTSDLIFDTRQLISYLSCCMTLLPGTAIMTGTPGGVGMARQPQVFLSARDIVEVEIDGIGRLSNPVVRE